MAKILRGDIVWAELDPVRGHEQGGRRPVLVISRDEFNAHSGTFIGLSLTSQEPKVDFPFTYELRATKLPKRSWVKISQIRLLSTERLVGHVGKVDSDELAVIVEGFNEIIGS